MHCPRPPRGRRKTSPLKRARGAESLLSTRVRCGVCCAQDSLAETPGKRALGQTKVDILSGAMLSAAPYLCWEGCLHPHSILPKSGVRRVFYRTLIHLPQERQGHHKQGRSEQPRGTGGLGVVSPTIGRVHNRKWCEVGMQRP